MNDDVPPPGLWLLRPTRRLVVGAELDADTGPRAHAVGDVGSLTAQHGVALCGLPVEALVLVPELDWGEVESSSRCGPCQQAFSRES